MTEKSSIKREIILILIGAIISGTTAFITNWSNAKRENKKAIVQKEFELNDQLAKDLGKRFYLTYNLYKEIRDKDSTVYSAAKGFELVSF